MSEQAELNIQNTKIVDTFAEAFSMRFSKLIVTALDEYWLDAALREFCGYGTSVISCDAEVGVEKFVASTDSPDGRPGASIMLFAFNTESLGKAISKRTGQ
ncbi:MAG: formylmethanofuran--tetrahydromethanopterin N-formyltransferase, partial [Planctomycetota bacterium]